jgi:hypothetical protein
MTVVAYGAPPPPTLKKPARLDLRRNAKPADVNPAVRSKRKTVLNSCLSASDDVVAYRSAENRMRALVNPMEMPSKTATMLRANMRSP